MCIYLCKRSCCFGFYIGIGGGGLVLILFCCEYVYNNVYHQYSHAKFTERRWPKRVYVLLSVFFFRCLYLLVVYCVHTLHCMRCLVCKICEITLHYTYDVEFQCHAVCISLFESCFNVLCVSVPLQLVPYVRTTAPQLYWLSHTLHFWGSFFNIIAIGKIKYISLFHIPLIIFVIFPNEAQTLTLTSLENGIDFKTRAQELVSIKTDIRVTSRSQNNVIYDMRGVTKRSIRNESQYATAEAGGGYRSSPIVLRSIMFRFKCRYYKQSIAPCSLTCASVMPLLVVLLQGEEINKMCIYVATAAFSWALFRFHNLTFTA